MVSEFFAPPILFVYLEQTSSPIIDDESSVNHPQEPKATRTNHGFSSRGVKHFHGAWADDTRCLWEKNGTNPTRPITRLFANCHVVYLVLC